MSKAVAEVHQVTRKFGKTTAVNNVSFTIEKGSTVAILGPNGAGKTTIVSMMLGLIEPTEGYIHLFNKNPKHISVREKIGAMLQDVSVVDKLKVHEVIALFRSYYPSPLSMAELIALTGLEKKDLNKWADKLSGGQKRRVGFALALTGNPDLVFFDEPTVGLDITARRLFWEKVNALKAKGKTIIFTTHYLQEADDVAERIILFNRGEIIADGHPNAIKQQLAIRNVSFQSDDTEKAIQQLQSLPVVSRCYQKDERIYAVTEDTDAVLAALFKLDLNARNIAIEQGRLEEVFEYLTKQNEEALKNEQHYNAM
ncbi:ABC transporter ATP-binding protein [Oceanobacillus polygoni]|uniref:ABC-2 type transport system ATP-binding protein n=1 Tax=Oceanobacillus polygoni TaxID=1235259 RepID=A0A9X0Z4K8_9BACI|nr:ABC transporter ATP-binding protein [Oceanobacillus polygoni]MBP2080176.1 ABC-2 type transport system ATP-binding protein [Oceanobacillus polygoni]